MRAVSCHIGGPHTERVFDSFIYLPDIHAPATQTRLEIRLGQHGRVSRRTNKSGGQQKQKQQTIHNSGTPTRRPQRETKSKTNDRGRGPQKKKKSHTSGTDSEATTDPSGTKQPTKRELDTSQHVKPYLRGRRLRMRSGLRVAAVDSASASASTPSKGRPDRLR